MQDGFIKVAALTPQIKVADVEYNTEVIIQMMQEAYKKGAKVLVFPELCITGYTCQDLFYQKTLLEAAQASLWKIASASLGNDAVVFVGLPLVHRNKLYNVAAAFSDGRLLALIPKVNIPNYAEFYEVRHFAKGEPDLGEISFAFQESAVPIGTNILISVKELKELVIGAEICEDLWVPNPPSTGHALHGATLIVNLSASNEVIGKEDYRKLLVEATSARLIAGYVYASAGDGESTQDLVFSGHNLIAENGVILEEAECFQNRIIYGDIDFERIVAERKRMNTFENEKEGNYRNVQISMKIEETVLERHFSPRPFVPANEKLKEKRCERIFTIQAKGLEKRLAHIGCKDVVIGLSGGLDSTLALLVTYRAFKLLEYDPKGICAVTMPCFGTTDRTYQNATALAKSLGATLREIDIKASVRSHFRDISHDEANHDVVYENGQARERTQILMDVANQVNGIVIGTGDMSELALGWATYNGDHMSMYGVNAGVPKTLVRHLVAYYAKSCQDDKLEAVLNDILETPVSPELLPPKDGVISQITEDLVGPYELHDFYLYYMLRCAFSPKKIYRLAKRAFAKEYAPETILKWEKVFYRRFFTQQFKRSCLPDGPKVGSSAVSPRGDLRMPSDAVGKLWIKELEDCTD